MKYPALADKIIGVLKDDTPTTCTSVATALNEIPEKVRLTINQMGSLKSFWFEIQKQSGSKDLNIVKKGKFENEIFLWKRLGGFSNYQYYVEKHLLEDQESKEYIQENLEVLTASIKRLIKDSIKVRERANWSLFAATLAIIISIAVWVWSLK